MDICNERDMDSSIYEFETGKVYKNGLTQDYYIVTEMENGSHRLVNLKTGLMHRFHYVCDRSNLDWNEVDCCLTLI